MQIKLLDTGWISHKTDTAEQNQLGDSSRAGYTGSAVTSFTLETSSTVLQGSASTESKPVVDNRSNVETTATSTTNDTINVTAVMRKVITTTGYDINDAYQLWRMQKTQGLKILYPSDTSETDGFRNIIEAFGAVNTGGNFSSASNSDDSGTVATTTPYVVGRVLNMTISDSSDGDYWDISFTFEVSG